MCGKSSGSTVKSIKSNISLDIDSHAFVLHVFLELDEHELEIDINDISKISDAKLSFIVIFEVG